VCSYSHQELERVPGVDCDAALLVKAGPNVEYVHCFLRSGDDAEPSIVAGVCLNSGGRRYPHCICDIALSSQHNDYHLADICRYR
jgi:hypothetical protein